jgi:hypothetical protein
LVGLFNYKRFYCYSLEKKYLDMKVSIFKSRVYGGYFLPVVDKGGNFVFECNIGCEIGHNFSIYKVKNNNIERIHCTMRTI